MTKEESKLLGELSKELNAYRQELSQVESSIYQKTHQISTLESEVAGLNIRKGQLESKINVLDRQVDSLSKK